MTPWQLPPERPGVPACETLAATRAAVAGLPDAWPTRADVDVATIVHGGVACLDLTPARPQGTMLYFHGGGYRLGSPAGWAGFAAHLAARLALRTILPDYRLAPEAPFPAALWDGAAVWDAIAADGPLLVGGDSAGGGLAAGLTMAARASGRPSPAGAILLSPWLDLTLSGETFDGRSGRDRLFPRATAMQAAASYLGRHAADDPLASPLFGDADAFPPTLLFAGGEESLLADTTRFASRLALAGVSVETHVAAGMQHVWPVTDPGLGETRDAVAAMRAFVDRLCR